MNAPLPAVDVEAVRRDLAVRGYAVIPELMPRPLAQRMADRVLALMRRDPDFARKRYPNLHGVLDQCDDAEDVALLAHMITHPLVLSLVRERLGDDCQTSISGALLLKAGARSGYGWHVDTPLQWFTANGRPLPEFTMAINVVWMLSDCTAANGATRVVPYSHASRRTPTGMRCEPDGYATIDGEVAIEGPMGSCALIDHALWHAAGDNRSDRDRLIVSNPFYPSWLDGGNIGWPSVSRRVRDLMPPEAQRLHRHVAEGWCGQRQSPFQGS